ncbi:unnamed protein product [Prorocentrum cordatum]|uniref:Uncharacterized protein n=1 Tax=Prorocentrum cordatum TaxID=2364126 RepID=A0ABN9UFP3_9DINO|nr:unnamed protein product [Polarella glacialis]
MGVMPSAVFSVSFLLSTGVCCATELKTYMARTDGWVIDSASARSCTAICSEVGKTCTAASETIMTNAAASASALKTALGSQFSTFCPGGVQDTNPSDDVPFLFAPGNFCEYGRGSYRSRCETAGESWQVRRICYCQATPAPSPAPRRLRQRRRPHHRLRQRQYRRPRPPHRRLHLRRRRRLPLRQPVRLLRLLLQSGILTW